MTAHDLKEIDGTMPIQVCWAGRQLCGLVWKPSRAAGNMQAASMAPIASMPFRSTKQNACSMLQPSATAVVPWSLPPAMPQMQLSFNHMPSASHVPHFQGENISTSSRALVACWNIPDSIDVKAMLRDSKEMESNSAMRTLHTSRISILRKIRHPAGTVHS